MSLLFGCRNLHHYKPKNFPKHPPPHRRRNHLHEETKVILQVASGIMVETFTSRMKVSNLAEMFVLTYSLLKLWPHLKIDPLRMLVP